MRSELNASAISAGGSVSSNSNKNCRLNKKVERCPISVALETEPNSLSCAIVRVHKLRRWSLVIPQFKTATLDKLDSLVSLTFYIHCRCKSI